MTPRQTLKWTRSMILTFFFLVLFLNPGPVSAIFGGKINSFTADQVDISPQGQVRHTTKLYVSPDVFRMDGMPGGYHEDMPKQDISMFIFQKDQQHYIFNHDKKIYFNTRLEEDEMTSMLHDYREAEKQTVIGKETVSGLDCVVKTVTTTFTVMGMETTSTITIWESDQLEIPVRTKDEDGHITELRNIKKGHPGKKYFEMPNGYRKVDNMMEVFGLDFESMQFREDDTEDDTDSPSDMPRNMPDVNMEEMMEAMKALGNMDPEQMEQMQQAMAMMMTAAGQTRQGPGAADGLWQIIPKNPGDMVADELYTPNVYNVVMGTHSSLDQVFVFYENALKPNGWKDDGKFIREGAGHFSMTKGDQQVLFSTADNPGIPEDFKLFYNIQLTGPGL